MKKEKNVQLIIITIMAVILAGMSIGFAAFSQSLTITGTANVDASSWSVKIVGSSSESSEDEVTHSYTGTTGTFTMLLDKPGTTRDVKFDIANEGTIDAKLTHITVSGVSEEQWKYLEISAEIMLNDDETIYLGGDIDDWNDYINNNEFKAGDAGHIKLDVTYTQPSEATDLPTETQFLNLSVTLSFEQL